MRPESTPPTRRKENALFYHIGRRDLQVLTKDDGGWSYGPLDPSTLADSCKKISERLKQSKPKIASLSEHPEAEEGGVRGLEQALQAFDPEGKVYWCFPIMEKALQAARKILGQKGRLDHVALFSTNRQDKEKEARAEAYREREPWAFSRFLTLFLRAQDRACKVTDYVVLRGEKISQDVAYLDLDTWFAEKRPKVDHVFLATSAGIPAINDALRTLALDYYDRVTPLDIRELEPSARAQKGVATVTRFLKERHAVLEDLAREDFESAKRTIDTWPRKATEGLLEDVVLAANRLAGRVARCGHEITRSDAEGRPSWAGDGAETDVGRLLTHAIHAFGHKDVDMAAVSLISAVDQACKATIEKCWPGSQTDSGYVKICKLCPAAVAALDENIGFHHHWHYKPGESRKISGNAPLWATLLPVAKGSELASLLGRARPLREARNDFVHRATQVPREVFAKFLQIEEDTPGRYIAASAPIQQIARACSIKSFSYWPADASADLRVRVRQIRLSDLFNAG